MALIFYLFLNYVHFESKSKITPFACSEGVLQVLGGWVVV
ncbi:hypothetical protein TRICHSKD4_0051 [Roseibium sp. TrichSKD4]|nr:hypothetical protein TRICHSKD4_0051 [Roseibium sp. TrichSKD4]